MSSSSRSRANPPVVQPASVRDHILAAALVLWIIVGLALVGAPGSRRGSLVSELVDHFANPEIYRSHGLILWLLGPYLGAFGLAFVVSLLFQRTTTGSKRQFRRELRAAKARQNNRRLFAAVVVVLGAAALVHLAGLASLVDRTPRDFEWETFVALDLACTLLGVWWIRSAWRRRGWTRWIRVIASWVTTTLPVVGHALTDLESPVDLTSIALYAVLATLVAHGLWAKRAARRLIATATVLSIGCLVVWLPIWMTVSGARSYVGSPSGSFHEECDFELAFSTLWSVDVPHDSVCPTQQYSPWVFGVNALVAGGLVALGVIGGRRITRMCTRPIARRG